MSIFCLVQDNAIVRYNVTLPTVIGNTSIPIGATGLEQFGLFPVIGEPPECDPVRERIAGPSYRVEGQAVMREWSVETIPDDEKAGQVREDRNKRLSDTDWTQVADAPVDQTAWATYRQALRDVPAQAGFPWAVEWPDRPGQA